MNLEREQIRLRLITNEKKTKFIISCKTRYFKNLEAEKKLFLKLKEFKNLISVITCENKVIKAMNNRLQAGSLCYAALSKLDGNKNIPRRGKPIVYRTILNEL